MKLVLIKDIDGNGIIIYPNEIVGIKSGIDSTEVRIKDVIILTKLSTQIIDNLVLNALYL